MNKVDLNEETNKFKEENEVPLRYFEYDFTRKPINPVMKTFTIGNKTFTSLCFDTIPFENAEEYILYREVIDKYNIKLKTVEDVEKLHSLVEQHKDKINKNRK